MKGAVVAHARPGRVRSYVPLLDATSGEVVQPLDLRFVPQLPVYMIQSNYTHNDQQNGENGSRTLLDTMNL